MSEDKDLWRKFTAKLIEQTRSGEIPWSVYYTPECRTYCTCTVLDRLMCFWPDSGKLYVVATASLRFYLTLSEEEIVSLTKAIKDQLSPAVEAHVLAFVREYLGQGLT